LQEAQKYSNLKNSYNMINEYLENPKKMESLIQQHHNNISCYIEGNNRHANKSRGPNGILRKKNFVAITGQNTKKMSFKSFDQRRALTRIDKRESSLEDPINDSYIALYANPLRSSSACHKKSLSNERSSINKKQLKVGKSSSQRHKKMKQNGNSNTMKRISATQAMLQLMKNGKRR